MNTWNLEYVQSRANLLDPRVTLVNVKSSMELKGLKENVCIVSHKTRTFISKLKKKLFTSPAIEQEEKRLILHIERSDTNQITVRENQSGVDVPSLKRPWRRSTSSSESRKAARIHRNDGVSQKAASRHPERRPPSAGECRRAHSPAAF
jgi:hypothetical protein